jgi:hypothetical protein
MILLTAILGGLASGFVVARIRKRPWRIPVVKKPWLALFAFVPQFIGLFLPDVRTRISDTLAAALLVDSLLLFLIFCWANRKTIAVWLLVLGLISNLLVISINEGFMPISRDAASRLVSPEILAGIKDGDRFGRKDILLNPQQTRLPWLSDWMLTPKGFPYQFAFSPGDLILAAGIFWLLCRQEKAIINSIFS